jgi:Tol biopolymer transport system component
MNSNGTGQTPITPDTFFLPQPVWSPNGNKIALRQDGPSGLADIWIMNKNGHGLTNLTSASTASDFDPDWGPAARKAHP